MGTFQDPVKKKGCLKKPTQTMEGLLGFSMVSVEDQACIDWLVDKFAVAHSATQNTIANLIQQIAQQAYILPQL